MLGVRYGYSAMGLVVVQLRGVLCGGGRGDGMLLESQDSSFTLRIVSGWRLVGEGIKADLDRFGLVVRAETWNIIEEGLQGAPKNDCLLFRLLDASFCPFCRCFVTFTVR